MDKAKHAGPLSECRWPVLPERYASALRAAVRFIFEHDDSVIGIVASGTIIRGNPAASSDLDVHVIHTAPFRRRIQRFFEGVPAELFVNPPAAVEGYLHDECAAGRPLTAHMLATGFPVYALGPTVERLQADARALLERPPAPFEHLQLARYLVATAFEDAADVAGTDEATARLILSHAAGLAVDYFFLREGRYLPRQKERIGALAGLDPDAALLATRCFSDGPFPALLDAARALIERSCGATGFFEWESEPEEIGMQVEP